MTGFNYKKTRHYAESAFGKKTRPDFDFRAILFAESQKMLSSSRLLDASYAVKAAMPSSDSDGKKRTLQDKKKSPYVNSRGMVYDPKGKWAPGKFFKHYVTDAERIEALKMDNPNPNWGWLDPDSPINIQPISDPKNDLRLIVETKQQTPKQEYLQEKGILGRSIGERNPGGKLASRAARAFGVIVDSLGKFRCPPGTPAANQFTNERGENCFSVSAIAQEFLAETITNFLQWGPKDKATIVSALLSAGITYAQIRNAYQADGMRGLASLASGAGIPEENLVGDEFFDGSYRTSALKKILDRARQTENTVSRTRAKSQQRREMIAVLFDRFGVEDKGDMASMASLMERLRDHGYFHPDFDSKSLFVGGSPESHQEALLNLIFNSEEGLPLVRRDSGDIIVAKGRIEEYKASKAAGEVTPLTQWVDAALEREQQYMRGVLTGIIHMTETRPDLRGKIYPRLFSKRSKHYMQAETHAMAEPWGDNLDGKGGYVININPVPGLKGMPPMPKPGETMLYTAEGGAGQEEQWKLIASKLGEVDRMRTWAETHMTDLAATIGNGWEDFGAEVGIHEVIHVSQYEAMIPQILKTTGKKDIKELSNKEMGDAMVQIMQDPALSKEIFGYDIYDLVDKRLDALAGSYSGDTQQTALGILNEINSMPDGPEKTELEAQFMASLAAAAFETTAELGAAREMGLIEGKDIDDVLEFMGPSMAAPISIPTTPGGPLTPSSVIRPAVPPDAPTPARPGSSRPTVPDLVDSPVSVVEMEKAWGLATPDSPARGDKEYNIVRNRNGKVPQLILDGRMTKEDVSDHVLGTPDEEGKRTGGIVGQIRSIRNMRDRDTEKTPTARRRRKILNDLLDSLPLDEDELTRIGLDEGPLSDEDRAKLEKTVEILKNASYEYKQKAEEAREKFRNYEGVDTSLDYDDKDANYRALEMLDNEARMWDNLHNRIGRGLAASVNDLIDIRDNGPFQSSPRPRRGDSRTPFDGPRSPTVYMSDSDVQTIRRGQEARRSSDENSALVGATERRPQTSVILGPRGEELLRVVTEDAEISRAFSDNGMSVPSEIGTTAKEIENSRLIISGIDKSEVRKEIVVELSLEIPEGSSEFDVDDVSIASVVTDDYSGRGMESRGKLISAGRILGSKRTQKLLEKAGIDPENAETVRAVAQMGIAFAAAGPAGVTAQILRMGSRDAALAALDRAVEKGWIEPSTASRITSMIIDRVAPDGIPDDIKKVLEVSKDKIWTDENRQRAQELSEVAHERVMDLSEKAKEKASELASSAKEKASELSSTAKEKTGSAVSSIKERIRRRKEETPELEDSFFSDDPFALPRSDDAASVPDVDWDNPFKSAFVNINFKDINNIHIKQIKKKKRKNSVNLLLQPGQKAAFTKGNSGNSVVLPPGKMKITSVNDDGSVDAEFVSQVDTEEYLKILDKKFEALSNHSDYDIRSRAKENVQYAKKKRIETRMQKYTPPKSSTSSRMALEKSYGIMEDLSSRGINPFSPQYRYNYEDSVINAISVLRARSQEIVNTTELDENLIEFLESNSDTQIIETIKKFSIDLHNSLDRRVRISISGSELNEISKSGIVAQSNKTPSVMKLLQIKNKNRGVATDDYSPSTIDVSLVSSIETDAIEGLLYEHGTRVGSEEFYDSGKGIQIVLRPENSQRIGYSILPNATKPIYVSLDEDREEIIVGAILGNIPENSDESAVVVAGIIQAIIEKNYRYFIGTDDRKKIDCFIVGGISIDDIEHVKIPNSIFGYRGRRIPANAPIFGENSMRSMMKENGVEQEKIDKFFSQGGTIGGGFSPRFISYSLEVGPADKMKKKLLSAGIADVVFTNKDGIDMMSDDSWGQSGITSSVRGKNNLMKLAINELEMIIKKVSGTKEKQKAGKK